MIFFVVFEAICIIFSIALSKRMVKNRSGLAKKMIIGKDSKEDISKMLEIAVRTFNREPFETDLEKYTLKISKENGNIVKTEVETDRTHLIYDGSHEVDERVINKAWTEKGATIMNAFTIWAITFYFTFMAGLLIEIIRLNMMIN